MISLTCKCGNNFSVPEEMAALEIQCPRCGLLNDVPKLGDLRQLYPDGTYVVEAPPPEHEPGRLAEMVRTFGREKVDAQGEIDLRQVARSPQPAAAENAPPRVRPRYDPETGELIPPFEIEPEDLPVMAPADIPMATRVLPYAVDPRDRSGGPWRVILLLLTPLNLVAMLFVFLIQCAFLALLAVPSPAVPLRFSPLLLLGTIALIAHYVNIIAAVGPDVRDELPRILGDMNLREDIWFPFASAVISFAFCYFIPLVLVDSFASSWRLASSLLMSVLAFGTLLFPAVLLTSATSGSIVNLRPDRPWKMIGVIGVRYVLLVLVYIVSVVTGFLGSVGVLACLADLFMGVSAHHFLYRAPVAFPMLIVGILTAHYFCWLLGLAYRQHHDRFPWVLQFHHRAPAVLPGLHSNVK